MWKKIIAIIVVIVIIAIIVGIYFWYEADKKKPVLPPPAPVVVDTTITKADNWKQQITSTGTLYSFHSIVVKAEVPGRIVHVYVNSSQQVKKDQPLMQINPATYEAELAAAKAALTKDKILYEQQQKIYKKGFGDTQQIASAKAAYLSSLAKVNQMQSQLNLTTVRAPFAGTLGLRLVKNGSYVTAGTDLITLKVHHKLRIEFSVPEVYLTALRVGQDVELKSNALPGQTLTGTVYAVNNIVNPQTRSIMIRAEINENDPRLYDGLFAEVYLFLDKQSKVVVVPQTAVMYRIDGSYLYEVKNGHAELTKVVTGERRGSNVAIISGLSAGAEVVSAGQVKLRDGSAITSANTSKAVKK